jgi:peptidoglycan/xylan/chitin deacetylase (PgdA/CDA1 family)
MNPFITFPNAARAAVSLTYDDGIVSHFESVAPTLERYGLRGTFNITIARSSVLEHVPEWRTLAERGHELGNHSLFHPCRFSPKNPKAWVGPYNLEDYNERRLREELAVANCILELIDGQVDRTYANTCWDRIIGKGDEALPIEPILAEIFLAARGVLSHQPVDLVHTNWMNLGSACADRRTFVDLRDEVEALVQIGGWIIYTIHGVGDGTHCHFIKHEEHQQLVAWLSQNQDSVWTSPMIDVVRYLKQNYFPSQQISKRSVAPQKYWK